MAHPLTGRKQSPEHIAKRMAAVAIAMQGRHGSNYGKKFTEEHKAKIAASHIGIRPDEESKRKNSEWHKGKTTWMKGKKHSEESRKKIGLASKGRVYSLETRRIWSEQRKGEKCHLWKGGINPVRKTIRKSLNYVIWRKAIYERDGYTCQICGERGGQLHAHHLKRFSSLIEKYNVRSVEESDKCLELWEVNNGITLCEECHHNVHKKNMKLVAAA